MAKYLCIWVRAYRFSVTSFSKWLPGGHIRFFGFWMAWFRQRNSSLLSIFFKFHVHVLCGCRQKPSDCQLCRFQKGCLVILKNVQLQSTHCPLPPSPMGRGILVDHWSTISSFIMVWKCHHDDDSRIVSVDNRCNTLYVKQQTFVYVWPRHPNTCVFAATEASQQLVRGPGY